jgi:hypothetical protein
VLVESLGGATAPIVRSRRRRVPGREVPQQRPGAEVQAAGLARAVKVLALGIDLLHRRGGMTQDSPRHVQPEFLAELGGRAVPELVVMPLGDTGTFASDEY